MDPFEYKIHDRNGADGPYQDFLGIGNGKKKKKYANSMTEQLQTKYPPQSTAAAQQGMISALQAESAGVLEQRNSAKGAKRTKLTGQLRAYDEYYADAKTLLADLQTAESNPGSGTGIVAAVNQITVAQPVSGQTASTAIPGADSANADEAGVGVSAVGSAAAPLAAKKTNWLLYGGIAVGVVVLFFVITRHKKVSN